MIRINLNKAKNIAHSKRRNKKLELLTPFDIKATIPSEAVEAEKERQKIRDKDAYIQNSIDSAKNVDELKQILIDYNALQ